MRQFSRQEVLDRLNRKKKNNDPIIMSGAGLGIIATISDMAEIDMIMAYCTGAFRMEGQISCMGSMPFSDSVEETMRLSRMLRNVKHTPVAAGIDPGSPYHSYETAICQMMDMGFSGITNVPSVGRIDSPRIRQYLDDADLGFDRELDVIKFCRNRDIFTAFYGYTDDDVRALVATGVDAIGLHVGGTSGGLIGFLGVPSLEAACEKTQRMCEIAKSENPDVITFSHGGPFEGKYQIGECFRRTDVDGFIGASSLERIPVEKTVMKVTKEFLALKTR